jgi:lipoyl(octanoyl) transferase
MLNLLSSLINLSDYNLVGENFSQLDDRTIVVKKWNWEYDKAHAFQKKSVELLQHHTQLRILICCSHPRVLTNGRGLQKPRKGEVFNLLEFKKENYPTLPYPFFQIERGGGLTFHHPGQFIFYPILKLNPQVLSLSQLVDDIFDFSISVLNSWGVENLHHQNKLLGLWYQEKKLASMGIAIERLTTFHGMALNIFSDGEMLKALKILNPCGLSPDIYTSVEELISLPTQALEIFSQDFLKKISHHWK